jgi:hypothetical protein
MASDRSRHTRPTMLLASVRRSVPRRALLLVCAVALLAAQWVGWQHRVEHGDGTEWVERVDSGPAEHEHPQHDCAAVDALTLGAAALTRAPTLPPHTAVGCCILPTEVAAETRSIYPPFQSRAPPVFL